MRTLENVDVAGAVIVSGDGKILHGLKKPKSTGVYTGYWILPGGAIENGESNVQAVFRETFDETGVDLSPYQPELVDDGSQDIAPLTLSTGEEVMMPMRFFTFRFHLPEPANRISISPGDEFQSLLWIAKTRLDYYRLPPPSRSLFQNLGYLALWTIALSPFDCL